MTFPARLAAPSRAGRRRARDPLDRGRERSRSRCSWSCLATSCAWSRAGRPDAAGQRDSLAMLVLVAALFEPIAERRYEEKIRGRVVLGVDLSESMATADPVSLGGRHAIQSLRAGADRRAAGDRSTVAGGRVVPENRRRPRCRERGVCPRCR